MDPVVTVDSDSLSVEPGGQASVTVHVRNRSSIVEGFRLDVLGEAAPWARVLPDHVEVLPQGEAVATVLFAPPTGVTTRAGQVPFGVRAVSQVDMGSSGVAEGDLQVGGVAQSQARITPVTSKGRFSGKHRLEFSNWGNQPMRLRLEASDPDDALGFLVTPEVLDLPLGASGTAKLKVRARKPTMRGMPARRAFRVVGRPLGPGQLLPAPGPAPAPYGYDPSQPSVDGAFEQRSILSRGVVPLAILALGAAATIGYLSSRGSDDPAAENVAPPVPQGFVAAPISHDTVRLNWAPGERVDSYTVFQVDPAQKDQPVPPALGNVPDIDGSLGQKDIPGLAPGTEHCFQLAAYRGDAGSARTPVQCVATPDPEAPGAPPVPTDVQVRAGDEGDVRVTWADNSDGQASHVVKRGATVVQEVPAPGSELVTDLVDGELCYTVQAKLGDQVSEDSDTSCLDPAETGTAGPTGGPVDPENLGVVATPFGPSSLDDPSGLAVAQQRLSSLRADYNLENVAIIVSSDYAGLQPPLANASYLIVITGFSSDQQAFDRCSQLGVTCTAYTPGPPNETAAPPITLPP
jgi:hypothetical protein